MAINCGALPENLIESELFGHRKGAFTGCRRASRGLFEVADGGTLFLDEIGELPKAMQAKLLRVLESGEIRRVGDNEPSKSMSRGLCHASEPEEMVEAGEFREDLMFRINTFEIPLPPLRNRIADIPELAEHLFRRFCPQASSGSEAVVSPRMRSPTLQQHAWPGNVRELANVIEHATILSPSHPFRSNTCPCELPVKRSHGHGCMSRPDDVRELEMQAIHAALERHDGNKPAAAENLASA